MSEVAEVFRTLVDDSTGAGEPLISRVEGEVAAAKEGSIAFSFKDDSGNVILPQLAADGRLPVQVTPAGAELTSSAVDTIVALNTDLSVVTLTLTISTSYALRFATGSSFQPCIWRVEQTDDAAMTDVLHWVTGPGDFNYQAAPLCINVTAGASGTQELSIIVQQIRGPFSDVHATICAQEN